MEHYSLEELNRKKSYLYTIINDIAIQHNNHVSNLRNDILEIDVLIKRKIEDEKFARFLVYLNTGSFED